MDLEAEPCLLELLCALGALPPRMREVWADHELVGLSYAAVGAELGLTGARCSQIGRAAGEALRAELETPRP